jgi:hypothetical protein
MAEIEFIGKSAIQMGTDVHPISFGERFSPKEEYTIADYSFTDEKGKASNGCVFEINPYGSTRVMKITDPELTCLRIAIKGNGTMLRVSPDGEVFYDDLKANTEENPLIELKQGWVDCCIAGDEGMEVADISTPPFKPEMETEISVGDSTLPPEFWKMYKELKRQP